MPVHTVSEGDCLSSIAERYGFFWETLWNHPQNAHIVRDRKDPNTLAVGDAVFIPEKRMKSYVRSTGARYTWKVKGVPVKFRVKVQWGDEPRAGEPYVLTVDGDVHEGTTDGEGGIEVTIRPGARHASLSVGEGDRRMEYDFNLGAMPPAGEREGALARLQSLGFYDGDPDAPGDAEARDALLTFQRVHGLEQTGLPDDATKSALRHLHDGV